MTTAIIITLSALLGLSFCLILVASASKQRLLDRNQQLRQHLDTQKAERTVAYAEYITSRLADGTCEVWRITYHHGAKRMYSIRTLIKRFDTADADYNLNEATELISNISSELCYD